MVARRTAGRQAIWSLQVSVEAGWKVRDRSQKLGVLAGEGERIRKAPLPEARGMGRESCRESRVYKGS